MIELTKEQRHLIYSNLYTEYREKGYIQNLGIASGLCLHLNKLLDSSESIPEEWKKVIGVTKMNYLPELLVYKPRVPKAYWTSLGFKGYKTRLGWIQQAIEDTK